MLLWLAPGDASAIDRDRVLSQLQHRQWSRHDGYPGEARRLVRTSDGYLWLHAPGGLHQFDGVEFQRFLPLSGPEPLDDRLRVMRADAHGGLWLGFHSGGATRIRGGEVRRWPADEGALAGKRIQDFAFDAEGRAYAASASGVFVLEGDTWRRLPLQDEATDDGQVDDLVFAADGSLWASAHSGIWHRAPGADVFELVRPGTGESQIAGVVAAPDGAVYFWNLQGENGLCRLHPASQAACWNKSGIVSPEFDADGALWWGDQDHLLRLAHPERLPLDAPDAIDAAIETLPLGAEEVVPAPDGSLWVAGAQILHRLRETPVRATRLPTGALAAGDDGELWLASFSRGLMRIGMPGDDEAPVWTGQDGTLWSDAAVKQSAGVPDGMEFSLETPAPDGEAIVLARYPQAGRTSVRLDRTRDGAFWVGTMLPESKLARVSGDKVEEVPLPPIERGAVLRGTYLDSRGDLWLGVSSTKASFYRRRDGRWEAHAGRDDVEARNAIGLNVDSRDRVWSAGPNNRVDLLVDGRWRRFGAADGLDVGVAGLVSEFDGQVWVLGTQGVAGYTGRDFVTLVGRDGRPFHGVTGLVQRENGDLWFFGSDGIFQIVQAEWRRSLRERGRGVAYTLLDHLDGVAVGAMQGAPLPSVAETSDGRLWFAGTAQLYWLRPEDVRPALAPPPVALKWLESDGTTHAPRSGTVLPIGTTRVAIAYAAPGAELPERTHFRHRLVGPDETDAEWVLAADRREVAYPRLAPGDYRFEVVASGRDGQWSETPATLEFRIEPAFHQTRAFIVLVVLSALLALTALYLLRLRQVSARIHAQMEARLAERERIARDLHDTLLQGVQALLLSFQAIANRLPAGNPERERMEAALDRAEEVVREGRDRVAALRDAATVQVDLASCLERHAEELSAGGGPRCEIVANAARPLQGLAHEQLLQVGREALTNAARHSQASQVRLTLDFAPGAVTLTVRDDGIGLPHDYLYGEGREGHWGLAGMRERAQAAGASLSFRVPDGGGTEIRMSVPAVAAYPASRPSRWRRWFALS